MIKNSIAEIKKAKEGLVCDLYKVIFDWQEKNGAVISKIDIDFIDVTTIDQLPDRNYILNNIKVYLDV